MEGMLPAAWRYRFFIVSSIRTEFRVRFIRSRLGGLWMILHPLATVLIFAFVLSEVLSAKLPGIENRHAYAIYLLAGILGWSLFAEIVSRCLTLFIDNGNTLKKLVFPRITLPLIITGGALVSNGLLLVATLVIFAFLGHWSGAALLWLPALMAVNIALALGLGLIFGVLNVFIRDIGQVVPVVMQFMFWLTPIVYMIEVVPQRFRDWLSFNPLAPVIAGYHNILLHGREPDWSSIGMVALLAAALLAFALLLFRKASPEMVDYL